MAAGPLQIAKRVLVTLLAIGAVGVSNLQYFEGKAKARVAKPAEGQLVFFY